MYVEAFQYQKLLIISHPVLRYPKFEKKFILTTDASNYAIGAVLSQEGHPTCFISRTLNNHERNYSATDKEFLAVVWSVKYLRPYLYGRKFKIGTDHQPNKFLHSKYKGKDMSPRHQRWLLKLGEYDFDIEYIKGKDNRVADFLSRLERLNEVDEQEDLYNTKSVKTITNIEDDNISNATAHSAKEELQDHFSIKEEIVNKNSTQIIITNNKVEEMKIIHNKKIIFMSEADFNKLEEIFK